MGQTVVMSVPMLIVKGTVFVKNRLEAGRGKRGEGRRERGEGRGERIKGRGEGRGEREIGREGGREEGKQGERKEVVGWKRKRKEG